MHNYFTPQGDPEYCARFLAMSGPQREFLARLGRNYRAYAPMRRGYGKTQDDGAYDIASNGRALIAMLDAEGIEKAVFLGRTPSQLDLLWLAENHPERIAGVIFLEGTPQVLLDATDPDMFALGAGFWRTSLDISSDIGKLDAMTVGRLGSYIPEFLSDPEVQIEVPVLYLEGPPPTEGKWMWLEIFRGVGSQVKCQEVTDDFPCNVLGNPERVARLEAALTAHPMRKLAAQSRALMAARFTDFRVDPFRMPKGPPSPDNMWAEYYDRVQPFLESIPASPE
ncbi:alpha/beta fold hydrolase [Erythrobacter dokdonensis]|nr:alpha/beta hydrolase [Erythrobacter dokdonensis]